MKSVSSSMSYKQLKETVIPSPGEAKKLKFKKFIKEGGGDKLLKDFPIELIPARASSYIVVESMMI